MNRTSENVEHQQVLKHRVRELPKEKNSKKREEIFKETAENVLNLLKSSNLNIQEALQTPNRINTERSTNRHIILKMVKVKSNRKILKVMKKKITYKGTALRLITDLSVVIKK